MTLQRLVYGPASTTEGLFMDPHLRENSKRILACLAGA